MKIIKSLLYISVGVCLFIGLSFMFYGCGGSGGGSDAIAASPPPPQDPGTPIEKIKPPAAFSSDGEFLGYVIGYRCDTPQHIQVYSDKINYRFVISNSLGTIYGSWGTGPYCIDDKCSDLYLYKNRLQDTIIGIGETNPQWLFNSTHITTDSSQTVEVTQIKYQKLYEVLKEPVLTKYCDGFIPPPTVENPNPQPIPPDCTTCGNNGLDQYGNPLYLDGNSCYGYNETTKFGDDGKPIYGFVCKKLSEDQLKYIQSFPGPYHKVISIDPQDLPFKYPVSVPIEIKVEY